MSESPMAKRSRMLGMSYGKATNRLRKMVLFHVLKQVGLNLCFRCGERIESTDELSLEHTVPWQTARHPKTVFFDVDRVAFSHLKCNSGSFNREKTHCLHGHEYTAANTFRRPGDGYRECRQCRREQNRTRWHTNGGSEKRRRRRKRAAERQQCGVAADFETR